MEREENYIKIIRRIGIFLTIAGVIDIVIFISIIKGLIKIYWIPFYNINAIIAGIFLYFRKSLRVANWVAFWCAAFMGVILGSIIVVLTVVPFDTIILAAKRNIFRASLFICELVINFLFFLWIYKAFTGEEIKKAIITCNIKVERYYKYPFVGFLISFIPLLIISIAFIITN